MEDHMEDKREKMRESCRKYYKKNRASILEKNNKVITCPQCQKKLTHANLTRHLKSKYHKKRVLQHYGIYDYNEELYNKYLKGELNTFVKMS